MKNSMCTDSVSLSKTTQERLLQYKTFAVAFSYPSDEFFKFFPQMQPKKDELFILYDKLFRAKEIWLYSTEYLAENEFQRVRLLSDIAGFYRAFALETNKERPDFLATELEFMHYLIFKQDYAIKNKIKNTKGKANVCLKAQRDFFATHLCPGAKNIVAKLLSQKEALFYKRIARELLIFLKSEEEYFNEASANLKPEERSVRW